jgi:hypothetical protein
MVKEFINDHLATRTIHPSQSPIGAPVLFTKRKDGALCMVMDYRRLNAITQKDRYPIPRIINLLEHLGKASIFMKIDLRNAYHLLRIKEGDEWKTAFRTRYSSFKFLVMPFGLTNAPSSFQRFMNTIFGDLLNVMLVIYLDDILVYSISPADHPEHVQEVLRHLRKHGLFVKPEKCEWGQHSVEFLGFHCSASGIRMDKKKVQVILDWPEPRNVRDIQSFLGFANFYCHFIPQYSDIIIPMTLLLQKDHHGVSTPTARVLSTCSSSPSPLPLSSPIGFLTRHKSSRPTPRTMPSWQYTPFGPPMENSTLLHSICGPSDPLNAIMTHTIRNF